MNVVMLLELVFRNLVRAILRCGCLVIFWQEGGSGFNTLAQSLIMPNQELHCT